MEHSLLSQPFPYFRQKKGIEFFDLAVKCLENFTVLQGRHLIKLGSRWTAGFWITSPGSGNAIPLKSCCKSFNSFIGFNLEMVSMAAVTSSWYWCEKVKRLVDVQVAGLNVTPGKVHSPSVQEPSWVVSFSVLKLKESLKPAKLLIKYWKE